MKKGLILTNAYTLTEGAEHQVNRLIEEFDKLGVTIDHLPNDFFACRIKNNNIESSLSDYDFCIYLDKDKYIAPMLEESVRLFNSAKSIEYCDDKMITFMKLAGHNIPMPTTLPGLLCHHKEVEIKEKTIEMLEDTLSYPLIMKSSYGSYGSGVHLIYNREQLLEQMEKYKKRPHLFQQYIASSHGKDLRVMVIGGKVISCMLRQSDNDFRSNLELGGSATAYPCSPQLEQLCVKVAELLELEYCGIDVLFGEKEEEYYICEVNSNAHFRGSEGATGINIAKAYADYIYKKIYENG